MTTPSLKKAPAKKVTASEKRKLPKGVCETYFFNPEHRVKKDPTKSRPCFYAYIGGKGNYKAKRFMIDTLGRKQALQAAKDWRSEHEIAYVKAKMEAAKALEDTSATKVASKPVKRVAKA